MHINFVFSRKKKKNWTGKLKSTNSCLFSLCPTLFNNKSIFFCCIYVFQRKRENALQIQRVQGGQGSKSILNNSRLGQVADASSCIDLFDSMAIPLTKKLVRLFARWMTAASSSRHVREFYHETNFTFGSLWAVSLLKSSQMRGWNQKSF